MQYRIVLQTGVSTIHSELFGMQHSKGASRRHTRTRGTYLTFLTFSNKRQFGRSCERPPGDLLEADHQMKLFGSASGKNIMPSQQSQSGRTKQNRHVVVFEKQDRHAVVFEKQQS